MFRILPEVCLGEGSVACALAEFSPGEGVFGGHGRPFAELSLDQAVADALELLFEPLSGGEEAVGRAAWTVPPQVLHLKVPVGVYQGSPEGPRFSAPDVLSEAHSVTSEQGGGRAQLAN
ncbi:hypothetical protein [Streptomyces sp. 142MFCol3.1]|uniref:hypothetical protein n=1 Tax=Streptomyces sp. 142MFCol3.1 TaxID=1172179 RepID=UPI001319E9E3|nr:hypothetical protein [Streptomyces sp. 142MFCol3.1]